MKKNFTIFYSWQSDLKGNRNFINSCIEKAIKEVKKKHKTNFDLQINLDRDTKNQSGSPNISSTILQKIDECDIFIGDVSLINNSLLNKIIKPRLTPNPNVLIELGYAINLLGWERIICVNNLKYGKTEELPFDIRGHRITPYKKNSPEDKVILIGMLKGAILSIIEDYENIEINHKLNDHQKHDKLIWSKINEISPEHSLMDGISLAVDCLFTNKYYYDKWDRLTDFYRSAENYFIDKETHDKIQEFILELGRFDTICNTHFFSRKDKALDELMALKEAGVEITEDIRIEYYQQITYSIIKTPLRTEDWNACHKRIDSVQTELYNKGEKVKKIYRELVMIIKKRGVL